MGASINRGPQNRPKYIMVLVIGTTKMGPLICGNSQIGALCEPTGISPPYSLKPQRKGESEDT